MALATDLVTFFHIKNHETKNGALQHKTLNQFLCQYTDYRNSLTELFSIANSLVNLGYLKRVPVFQGDFILGDCFLSTVELNDISGDYGVYDFLCYGFPLIRSYFSKSVLPIEVYSKAGPDCGTGFLFQDRVILTAAHCISNMDSIIIPGIDFSNTSVLNIFVSKNQNPDIGMIIFKDNPLPEVPSFKLQKINLLDEVLTMGFPPIPGFQTFQVSETATVSSFLKSSTGIASGIETSYLDQIEYILISARVKGGNSGGPIIGRHGGVAGIVTGHPAQCNGNLDTLGYGIGIPHQYIHKFLEDANNKSNNVEEIEFSIDGPKLLLKKSL